MTELNGDSPAAQQQAAQTKKGLEVLNRPDVQQALAGLKNMPGMGGWTEDSEKTKKQKLFGIVINILVPIIPITFGAVFINDCPVQPMIPIWFIVIGAFGMISSLLELFVVLRGEHHTKTIKLIRLIHIFLPIWFIVGCCYVYGNYEPDYDAPVGGIIPGVSYDYCHYTLYTACFWYITSLFIMAGIAIFFSCCCCCCVCMGIGKSMSNKTNVENVTPGQMEAQTEKS